MKVPVFEHAVARPFSYLGFTGGFLDVHIDTLMYTWIGMAGLFLFIACARWYVRDKKSIFAFAVEQSVVFFSDLCNESFGSFNYGYFVFVCALFIFTLTCNIVGLLPFVEESTRDLNTTLAIALSSFLYVQYHTIRIEGIKDYVREFFQPIFLLLPLNIIDKVAKVVSMSFRLFGNILGGSIVFYLLLQVIAVYRVWFIGVAVITFLGYWLFEKFVPAGRYQPLRTLLNGGWSLTYCFAGIQMFFSLFEGVIQAFVIAMLTITYLSLLTEKSHHNEQLEKGTTT